MTKPRRTWVTIVLLALSAAGCGGKSLEAHSDAGGAGAPSGVDAGTELDLCASNADCRLLVRGCCACGTGPLTAFAAISRDSSAAFLAQQCLPGTACGPCPTIEPNANQADRSENYYVATCQAGHCVAVDLHEEPVTDCSADSDCDVRSGTECCDVCGNEPTIAFNGNAQVALQSFLCPAATKCRACDRPPPLGVGVVPHCEAGKCVVAGVCNLCR